MKTRRSEGPLRFLPHMDEAFRCVLDNIEVPEVLIYEGIDCFTDPAFIKIDLDERNTVTFPAVKGGKSLNLELLDGEHIAPGLSFEEMLQALFSADTREMVISPSSLIASGITFSWKQIENIAVRHIRGRSVSLNENGRANLFLAHDDEDTVSVVDVYRFQGNPILQRLKLCRIPFGWYVEDWPFGDDTLWSPGTRLLLRNRPKVMARSELAIAA